MNYKMIVAICKGNGIGNSNSIPWYSPVDLKHFSKLTRSTGGVEGMNAIIMGRKTWDSIPKKPLPQRFHIILTRQPETIDLSDAKYKNCVAFSSMDAVEQFCKERNFVNNWVIGGQSIYEKYLRERNISDIHVTKLHEDFECDVFFPEISQDFSIVSKDETMENNIKLDFIHYSNYRLHSKS